MVCITVEFHRSTLHFVSDLVADNTTEASEVCLKLRGSENLYVTALKDFTEELSEVLVLTENNEEFWKETCKYICLKK